MAEFRSDVAKKFRDALLEISDCVENAPYMFTPHRDYKAALAGSSSGNCNSSSHSGNSSHSASSGSYKK